MIYLDHAAATPLSGKARKAMEPYFADQFWNPSAPYLPAQKVRDAYEAAKDCIARAVGGKGTSLTITASATESINLAFNYLYGGRPRSRKNCVLICATEHPAVFAAAGRVGKCRTIGVDRGGVVDLADLKSKITENTEIISIALVSSDLGTIQPLAKVAEIVRAERQARRAAENPRPLYLHTDATAALPLLDVKVARLGVDMLTISAAKIYGPKGVAALWTRPGVLLEPLIVGGGQEGDLRSGTENVPGVIGFAAAVEDLVATRASEQKRLERLKHTFCSLLSANSSVRFLGDPKHQLASHLPIAVPGLDAERLIYKLEESEVYVSTGAACAASKHVISPALLAIGLGPKEIRGHLRVTLGRLSTEENVEEAARLILAAILKEQDACLRN